MLTGIDEAAEDVRRLATELDMVLARRPVARGRRADDAGRVRHAALARKYLDDEAGFGELDFEWLAAPDKKSAQRGTATAEEAAEQASRWISRAKRKRMASGFQHAGAWALAFLIGAAVVLAASYLMLGTLPDPEMLMSLGAKAVL